MLKKNYNFDVFRLDTNDICHYFCFIAGAAAPIDGAYKVESAQHPQPHDGLYYQV